MGAGEGLPFQHRGLFTIVGLKQGVRDTEIDLVVHQVVGDQLGVLLTVEGDSKVEGPV